MAVTSADLQAMLQGVVDDPYLDVAVAQAVAFVGELTAASNIRAPVPETILDRATLDIAADIWSRRSVTNGLAQFSADDLGTVQAVRIRNDLLAVARPTLAPWLGGGFA